MMIRLSASRLHQSFARNESASRTNNDAATNSAVLLLPACESECHARVVVVDGYIDRGKASVARVPQCMPAD